MPANNFHFRLAEPAARIDFKCDDFSMPHASFNAQVKVKGDDSGSNERSNSCPQQTYGSPGRRQKRKRSGAATAA
jgi:hypothetical protein